MFFDEDEILHIPHGINFDCTGCGNCCLQWPVPSTDEDRRRIIDLSRDLVPTAEHAGSNLIESFSPVHKGQLFRRIDMDVLRNNNNRFQYTMEKRADGRCVFLTAQNRCLLHEQFGAEAKPSMCQLFPYTFTEAPDGFYASVSFASSGALLNHGKPLADQREHLLNRMKLFKKMFPNLKLDWSQIQLVDGVPIRWAQYLLLERPLLADLQRVVDSTSSLISSAKDLSPLASKPESWCSHLETISSRLVAQVTPDFDLERTETVPATSISDLLLVKYLLSLYLPEAIFAPEDEPDIRGLLKSILDDPSNVLVDFSGKTIDLANVCAQPLSSLPGDCENLLARYLFARVYSKLFFGPGLAHFSLVAGYHHLAAMIALIRIRIKCLLWSADDEPNIDFFTVSEIVRNLERRLASYQHSNESATVLQVLFESPARFKRLLKLAN